VDRSSLWSCCWQWAAGFGGRRSVRRPKSPRRSRGETPKILSIPESDIVELKITKGPETIALTKVADRWQIIKPMPLPADAEAVGMMTSMLGSLTGDRLIDDKPSNLSIYGLDNPSARVDITKKDGKVETLVFGADTVTIGEFVCEAGVCGGAGIPLPARRRTPSTRR
jgi:hypothetical protein